MIFRLAFSSILFLALPCFAGFPEEGRWSIATGWSDGWPAEWHHAKPTAREDKYGWVFHHGAITLDAGELRLRDAVRELPGGLTEVRRRWHWTGEGSLRKVTLSFRWQADAVEDALPFLPGISIYDNPSGRRIDAKRVPVIAAASPHRRGFYEEHRFPLPFAAVEGMRKGDLFVSTLHTLPSPAAHGNLPDQWWSLGVEYRGNVAELASYSGPVASNGRNAMIKGFQRQWFPYDSAWLDLPPGCVIEKRYYIEEAPVERPGDGFRTPLWSAIRLAGPADATGFPPLVETVELKFADTWRRWREGDGFAGIDAFPGEQRPWIDLGWAGQSEAFAYPALVLNPGPDNEVVRRRATSALDFITRAPFGPDGFAVRYDYRKREWAAATNPLSQGQAMHNMAEAIMAGRERPGIDTSRWETFLAEACAFHADRILGETWRPVSTNEAFLIGPLAISARLLGRPRFMRAAILAAEHYAHRHRGVAEPYWGGTLDARCEDKEAAWAALLAFVTLHEETGDPRWIEPALHAADHVLCYLYLRDVPMPPGRLADHAFRSRGWTSVSVQNMHLDVYGVLCAPTIWKLADLTGKVEYRELARLMTVSCGQLLDPSGRHGEQLHQTNFAQHYRFSELRGVRGDYIENWDVYWMSAHFLVAAARFDNARIPWREW
jgi:hypothetical protein